MVSVLVDGVTLSCRRPQHCPKHESNLIFFKAFDSVPHRRLRHKLERYGIDGPLLNWFQSFLIGRSQRVVLRGSYSSWTQVKSGVPQETILGPFLFIMYVNYISTGVSSTVKLYADDTKLPTKLYSEMESIPDDTHVLQDKSKKSYIVDPNCEILTSVKNIYHGAVIVTKWSIKPTKSLGSLSACLCPIV